jgi:hypothetical protein
MRMTSASEAVRINAIKDRISTLFDIGVDSNVSELLDDLVLDVEWLSDRLNLAWSTVAAYQKEISVMYEGK